MIEKAILGSIWALGEHAKEARELSRENDDLRAANARLRQALMEIAHGMAGPDEDFLQYIDGISRRALASTDASQWLAERERRVAERVREASVQEAARINDLLLRGAGESSPGQRAEQVIRLIQTLDLDALLKVGP